MLRMSFFFMYKFIFLFLLSFNSYTQEFVTFYISPVLPVNQSEPLIDNSLFFNFSWNPNKYLGNTFYIGTADGALFGSSLDFIYSFPHSEKNFWYFNTGIKLPFLMQLKDAVQKYYFGFNYNLSFSIALKKDKSLYFFFEPISFYLFPFNWIDNTGEDAVYIYSAKFYYSFALGLRKPI